MNTSVVANASSRDATSVPADRARPEGGSFVDPETLMSIKNLELRAKVVVEGFWSGLHRSPYHGFSVEFTEYRPYAPGDDPRYLDWKLFARSDRYYLKKYEDETNLRCYLLVDSSHSMAYGSVGYDKAEYARTLAATLAYFLYRQGDAVGLLTFDERIRDYLPARHRMGHLRHLMLKLEEPAAGQTTDLAAPLERLLQLVRKRSLVVLVSDLLAATGPLERQLVSMTAAGHEVLLFHLLDPAEIDFEFKRPVRFRDVESGRELYIDPEKAREDYLRLFEEHNRTVLETCQRLGVGYRRFSTARPLELSLLDFLQERMRRDRLSRGIRRTNG